MSETIDPLKVEFDTPSKFPCPPGSKPLWTYRNTYPKQIHSGTPRWVEIDYKSDPKGFVESVKDYILDGNLTSEGNLCVGDKWYHPPWLHFGDYGREPISGLKYAGAMAPDYISDSQNRYTQCWLNTYFNEQAASILYDIWGDGTKTVKWIKDIKYPQGSLIFETVYCDATEEEIGTLNGAPTVPACIIDRPAQPYEEPDVKKRGNKANTLKVDTLRLLQTDFAARVGTKDDPCGWVFGTLIHDGTVDSLSPGARWNHLIPVGIQRGNKPVRKAYDVGSASKTCWINPQAPELINSLRGVRPWLGWQGRLNGPIDNFMNACVSCHSTFQFHGNKRDKRGESASAQYDDPNISQHVRVVQPERRMSSIWTEDLPAGHIVLGLDNYGDWLEEHAA